MCVVRTERPAPRAQLNRRQAKVNPFNNLTQLFLYDLGHQLLEDRSARDVQGENMDQLFSVADEYVWLGGRPLAVFRSKHVFDEMGNAERDAHARWCLRMA